MSQNAADAGVPNPLKRKAVDDPDPTREVKHPKPAAGAPPKSPIVIDVTGSDDDTEDFGPADNDMEPTGTDEFEEDVQFEAPPFDLEEIDPADSVLPDDFPEPLAAYVRARAARIVANIITLPVGHGAGAAHFRRLRQRYLDHPRPDRPLGAARPKPGKAKKELPINAGEKAANAIADEYNLEGLGDTWKGWWASTGRSSVPIPMVGRRDLQLLSQLSQLLINHQHATEVARVDRERAQARAQKAKQKKAKQQNAKSAKAAGGGSADVTMKAEPAVQVKSADLTQEVEAMIVGDRLLISANEQWAVDHLCAIDLRALLTAKQTPAGGGQSSWQVRKERKIADLAAALCIEVEGGDDAEALELTLAEWTGMARLVQLEVDCQLEPDQRDAVRAILGVLRQIMAGDTQIVGGGAPDVAKDWVSDGPHAGHVIVVDACVDNQGKALTHAEQNIVYTALLAGYAQASSVAGGKRPCTVCWLTLRMARGRGHDINFNWHPGGFWRGSTFRGLALVARVLGLADPDSLREEVREICADPANGLVQYVTQLAAVDDPATTFQVLGDLHTAVLRGHNTDTATQSFSESYHDIGSLSSQGSEDERGDDEDVFSTLWRDDVREAEFEEDGELELEGAGDEDEGEGEAAAGVDPSTQSGVAVLLSLLPAAEAAGVQPIPQEVIELAPGPNTFGSAPDADILLPGAPAQCFIAVPDGGGVTLMLFGGKGDARKIVRFGTYLTAGPYVVSFTKLDRD